MFREIFEELGPSFKQCVIKVLVIIVFLVVGNSYVPFIWKLISMVMLGMTMVLIDIYVYADEIFQRMGKKSFISFIKVVVSYDFIWFDLLFFTLSAILMLIIGGTLWFIFSIIALDLCLMFVTKKIALFFSKKLD